MLSWVPYGEWETRERFMRELYGRWGLPYIEVYKKGDDSEKAVAQYISQPTSENADQNESI